MGCGMTSRSSSLRESFTTLLLLLSLLVLLMLLLLLLLLLIYSLLRCQVFILLQHVGVPGGQAAGQRAQRCVSRVRAFMAAVVVMAVAKAMV